MQARTWLTEARKRLGKSQQAIADELGIAQSTYAGYELGIRTPAVPLAKKIGAALGIDWVMFYEDESGQPDTHDKGA